MDILVIDGYNIIGDWEELRRLKRIEISHARNRLIERLIEYQAYTGTKVIIVFDAMHMKGIESRKKQNNVEIIYTDEEETADEYIERLVTSLINVKDKVYVATSDYMEQRTIFSRGALRISARELQIEIEAMNKNISQQLEQNYSERPKTTIEMNKNILNKFRSEEHTSELQS